MNKILFVITALVAFLIIPTGAYFIFPMLGDNEMYKNIIYTAINIPLSFVLSYAGSYAVSHKFEKRQKIASELEKKESETERFRMVLTGSLRPEWRDSNFQPISGVASFNLNITNKGVFGAVIVFAKLHIGPESFNFQNHVKANHAVIEPNETWYGLSSCSGKKIKNIEEQLSAGANAKITIDTSRGNRMEISDGVKQAMIDFLESNKINLIFDEINSTASYSVVS